MPYLCLIPFHAWNFFKIQKGMNFNMENQKFCQSCGLPFDEAHKDYQAREADGSSSIYCTFCYMDGAFLHPTQRRGT